MVRRDFLARLGAGAAWAGLGRNGGSFAYTTQRQATARAAARRQRIAVSTWSLHNYFRATRGSDFTLPGPMLALLDIPELIADKYKVHHLEFCASQFGSTEPAYLREIKYTLVHTGSTIVNICLDIKESGGEGTFSDPDRKERLAALDAAKRWVDIAQSLGVRSVCLGPGKVDREKLGRTAESYKVLLNYAQAKAVRVVVENCAGFGTEHPEELVNLLKLAGSGSIGALPDFANFPDEATREKGLRVLFPYAQSVCHVPGVEFDPEGAEKTYDFPKAMEIAKRAGFRGVYSIEFDGPGDPYTGIQKTLNELLKYL